jgi:hypothetical protein
MVEPANLVSEVVWIKDRSRLVDAESYERSYGSNEGRAMTSGYYIANWPPGTTLAHFLHRDLTFMGPFSSRREAEAALAGMARQLS